jgi:hypothetical protein
LKKLNGDAEIEQQLKNRIETFFEFKWNCDKNNSISEPEEVALLE